MIEYARAVTMPGTLKGTVSNCFHEQHFAAGVQLLESLSSARDGSNRVYIPAPEHLSLLATLAVHPDFVNDRKRYQEVSAPACRYLRRLITAVGPLACNIGAIWRFDKHERNSRRKRKLNQKTGPAKDLQTSKYEVEESLWGNAENLWQVVGWGFSTGNTAWLGFIHVLLHVLETDLKDSKLEDSLIVHYLRTDIHSELGWKKALKAIFGGNAAVDFQVAPIYQVSSSADTTTHVGHGRIWNMESVLLRQQFLSLFAELADAPSLIKKDDFFTNLASYLFIDLSYDDYIKFISLACWKHRDKMFLCTVILRNYGAIDGRKISLNSINKTADVSAILTATSNTKNEFRNAKIRVAVDHLVQDFYIRQKMDPVNTDSTVFVEDSDYEDGIGEETVDAQMHVLVGINRGYMAEESVTGNRQ